MTSSGRQAKTARTTKNSTPLLWVWPLLGLIASGWGLEAARSQQPPSAPSSSALERSPEARGSIQIAVGQAAFAERCTTCHDASRSMKVSRAYSGWIATIDKMAAKEDADIPAESRPAIAAYLTATAGRRSAAAPSPSSRDNDRSPDPSDDSRSNAAGRADRDENPNEGDSHAARRSDLASHAPTPDPAAQARSEAGALAFSQKCTTCHDAARSLEKTKSEGEWRATAQRMAAKPGADISSVDVDVIAAYLAGHVEGGAGSNASGAGGAAGVGSRGGSTDGTSTFSVFGTMSPTWRGGNGFVQNPGFFPDLYLGANWQPKKVPVSIRTTVCTSCHGNGEPGLVSRLEVLEAVARIDVGEVCGFSQSSEFRTSVEFGRFVTPFGAFSSQVNPGIYRTVSKPLIFNMGQRVREGDIGDTVLPLPYADEGVLLSMATPVLQVGSEKLTAALDLYAVNGLIGGADGIDFDRSRDYADNNRRPALGSRFAIGNSYFRAGASVTGGQFNDTPYSDPYDHRMNYLIYGFDVAAHYKDLIRVQAEYARRNSDRFNDQTSALVREYVQGTYVEGEVRGWEGASVSLLARYDWLDRGSPLALPESSIKTGNFAVHRFTAGVNIALFHQSLLMLNYERWEFPAGLSSLDVWGVRYAISF